MEGSIIAVEEKKQNELVFSKFWAPHKEIVISNR